VPHISCGGFTSLAWINEAFAEEDDTQVRQRNR
jgi:hypothetical protein